MQLNVCMKIYYETRNVKLHLITYEYYSYLQSGQKLKSPPVQLINYNYKFNSIYIKICDTDIKSAITQ